MEFYFAINKITSFTGKWVEPENILLSKRSQTQNDKYWIHSLVCPIYIYLKKIKLKGGLCGKGNGSPGGRS